MEYVKLCIITGSGLDFFPLLDRIEQIYSLRDVIPFLKSPIEGHSYWVMEGRIKNIPMIVCSGRPHMYEGYGLNEITAFLEFFVNKGITHLLSVNAVGSLNSNLSVGTFVTVGKIIVIPYKYFPSQEVLLPTPFSGNLTSVHYIWVTGPCYETKSELKYFKQLGGDVIGMSGAPELYSAQQFKICAQMISCITNYCFSEKPLSHKEVISHAQSACKRFLPVLREILISAFNAMK